MIKATVWLWLHTRLAQVSVTYRNRTASYILCGIKEKCKGPSKLTDTEKRKLSQLDLYNWCCIKGFQQCVQKEIL